jgi:endonuclease I
MLIKRLFLALATVLLTATISFAQSELIFSEYVEGSGNNKYLEIFNTTDAAVNLSGYRIELYANGATDPNNTEELSGTLQPNSVLVIANSNATAYNGDVTTSNVTFYNGNDALALIRNSDDSYLDIIGKIGEDPGDAWESGDFTTSEATIRRLPTVQSGVTQNPQSGFPTLGTEWEVFPQDNVDDLGQHTFSVGEEGESDFVVDATFEFTEFISPVYDSERSSSQEGTDIGAFYIRDGGADGDEDELPTELESITFDIANVDFLSTIMLLQNGNPVAEQDARNPTFSNLPAVSDDDSLQFSLRVSFNDEITDLEPITVSIVSASVMDNSSNLAFASGGSLLTFPADDNLNKIQISATQLAVRIVPTEVEVGMSFESSVQVTDQFGNVARTQDGIASLALGRGTGTLSTGSQTNDIELDNGRATWTALSYDTIEKITLTFSHPDFESVTSSEISVVEEIEFGEEILPGLMEGELISAIQDDYSVTSSLSYNRAREKMYAILDYKDGNLTGVYSGFTIQVAPNEGTVRSEAYNKGINAEHTWPQGLFDSNSPMVSDIHHLFPTKVDVNGARGSLPFGEIDDSQTDTWYYKSTSTSSIPSVDIDLYSEVLSNSRFEPREDHKGNTARAVFYFWTVYQEISNVADDESFFEGMKEDLYDWHRLDPADEAELARSNGAAEFQGNINPFVHDASLVARAYFPNDVSISDGQQPMSFELKQNYPNPFNPSTTISFVLDESSEVTLSVYDVMGRKVINLTSGNYSSGSHSVTFDAGQLSSGIYLYMLETESGIQQRMMTLIK